MSYEIKDGNAIIGCDKCHGTDVRPEDKSGKDFLYAGWTVNPRARKYVHLCYDCKPKKQKQTTDFVISNFGDLL